MWHYFSSLYSSFTAKILDIGPEIFSILYAPWSFQLWNIASNPTAPSKPIKGQLWYDESKTRLKVYSGATFQPLGGAVYQSTEPSTAAQGDIWIDSDVDQLYFYNGTSHVLVGPESSSTSGFTFPTITDSTDTDQKITQIKNNTSLIATVYDGSIPLVTITLKFEELSALTRSDFMTNKYL